MALSTHTEQQETWKLYSKAKELGLKLSDSPIKAILEFDLDMCARF